MDFMLQAIYVTGIVVWWWFGRNIGYFSKGKKRIKINRAEQVQTHPEAQNTQESSID